MKKILMVLIIVMVLVVGCKNKEKKVDSPNVIFRDELAKVFEIENRSDKTLVDELVPADIDRLFNNIFEKDGFEDYTIDVGEVSQGMGSDGKGGRIFCCKVPIKVTFVGNDENIKEFVKYFENIDNVVSFGEFNISALENSEKYKVDALINFCGKAMGGSLASSNTSVVISKKEVVTKAEDETELRNYDVSMLIRPSNSDASSIAVGVISDKDYRIYNDENQKKVVNVNITQNGKQYYCEYNIEGLNSATVEIKPKGNVLFDVLSCKRVESDDNVSVDLHLSNSSDKKLSVVIYEDSSNRVSAIKDAGNIEVSKK